jgi:Tol biopolymer transport system component
MKHAYRIAVGTTAAAVFAVLLLEPGRGQAPTAEEKAKTKAKAIAQTFELNALTITVFDRQGKVVATVGPRGLYEQPVLSPDAKRVAVAKTDLEGESEDIWVFDLATGNSTRISTSGKREQARAAVWSPDGNRLAYVALRGGNYGLYLKSANGEGSEELLYKLPGAGIVLSDWSLDGRFLNFYSAQLGDSILYALPLEGERKPVEVAKSTSQMLAARLSPDSRLMAYRSSESGKPEVYVRSFDLNGAPTGGGKWQISDGGLGMVAWRRDGQEMYYFAADRGIMAVSVSTSPAFEFGKPKLLFKAPDSIPISGTPGGYAGVSRDGQRFVFTVPPAPRLRQITVYDRAGKVVRTVGEPGLYDLPALSPDGTRVAVMRNDPVTNNLDIWSFDMKTGKGAPVTNDDSPDQTPIWSPDGKQILFASTPRGGSYSGIYRKAADGSGSAELLFRFTPGAGLALTDVSPDGKFVTFSSGGAVFAVALTGADPLARKAIEYVRDEYNAFLGRFSPDSRFMAFVSDETERNQLWVRRFDATSGAAPAEGKWQLSKDGPRA